MPRTALFQNPQLQREKLESLREFFDWLYTDYGSPERARLAFCMWWSGLPEERGAVESSLGPISKASVGFDWNALHARIRKLVEATVSEVVLSEFETEDSIKALYSAVKSLSGLRMDFRYYLSPFKAQDGREYLWVRPLLDRPLNETTLGIVVLDRVLRQLDGLAVNVLGRCMRKDCGRIFLRLRAKRRFYCSTRCTNLAALERNKSGPGKMSRTRRSRRQKRPREKQETERGSLAEAPRRHCAVREFEVGMAELKL